jgi:integrase
LARKVSFGALESRSARLKLAIRRRPYSGPKLARGILLMYRRNNSNGAWISKVSNSCGGYWTEAIAQADDFNESNGETILTFYEAQDKAKKLARGEDDRAAPADTAPLTVDAALADYRADLEARDADPYNADRPRVHLTNGLQAKPVALLTATELKKWRNSLRGAMAPATVNRLCRCLCAAFEQAAQHDKRIQNRDAWKVGLTDLPNAQVARNVILSDDKVREFVAVAYELDDKLGLLADTLAISGARPGQATRLLVEDLRDDPVRPRLMMPKAGKGGGRNRAAKKLERYSVPITTELAARLRAAARGQPDDVPLLVQSDGHRWPDNPGVSYHRDVAKVVATIGVDPDATLYCLRHSSIVRMLLRNVPVRVTASVHDTSVVMIEKHYSKFITEHSDEISRHALLQHAPPAGANVVKLK